MFCNASNITFKYHLFDVQNLKPSIFNGFKADFGDFADAGK